EWLDNQSAVAIDVRTPEEYQHSHIPLAILLPVDTLMLSQLPKTKKKIIIYCQHGIRSQMACSKLLQEDHAVILYNVTGGFSDWLKAGFAIQS
ncbi:MAG: rhodanese-like domain-containing protein, partial [Endozoicomonadaceae bacterium]|nr:rhodanese-like domain-containing protein [Endozoicomonadaceae bacterium]